MLYQIIRDKESTVLYLNLFSKLLIFLYLFSRRYIFKWRERRGLSWICSTLTEFRLKKLCFCRLNLFAIRICSLRSLHPSANPPNSQNTLLATINSAIKKSHTRWLLLMAGTTRLELATSCVTGMRSNQTELRSHASVFRQFLL